MTLVPMTPVPMRLVIEVNGAPRAVDASPWKRLLDVLREDLRLTGTKEGCGEGECGACTVLLDGEPVNACLVAAGQCDGRRVTTVEGLARGELLHAVQRQLVACGGAQCGICTPGIAVCAAHLVDRGLVPGGSAPGSDGDAAARAQVRELLAGNICRCTGYQLIVEAVIAAAREVAPAAPEPAHGETPGGAR
jgi:carbon-monoxide dehydrogenase small subunit